MSRLPDVTIDNPKMSNCYIPVRSKFVTETINKIPGDSDQIFDYLFRN